MQKRYEKFHQTIIWVFYTLISPMIQMFFGPDALDFLRSDGKTKKLENWVCGRSDNDLHSFRSDRSLTKFLCTEIFRQIKSSL